MKSYEEQDVAVTSRQKEFQRKRWRISNDMPYNVPESVLI